MQYRSETRGTLSLASPRSSTNFKHRFTRFQ